MHKICSRRPTPLPINNGVMLLRLTLTENDLSRRYWENFYRRTQVQWNCRQASSDDWNEAVKNRNNRSCKQTCYPIRRPVKLSVRGGDNSRNSVCNKNERTLMVPRCRRNPNRIVSSHVWRHSPWGTFCKSSSCFRGMITNCFFFLKYRIEPVSRTIAFWVTDRTHHP